MDRLEHIFPKLYATCYFECGSGWFEILRSMSEKLDPLGVQIGTVKEKFGGLRVYLEAGYEGDDWDYINSIISETESRSWRTCEECGEPGIRRVDRSWVKVFCDDCDTLYPCRNSFKRESRDGTKP